MERVTIYDSSSFISRCGLVRVFWRKRCIMTRDRNYTSFHIDRAVSTCDFKGLFSSSRARVCVLLGLIFLFVSNHINIFRIEGNVVLHPDSSWKAMFSEAFLIYTCD